MGAPGKAWWIRGLGTVARQAAEHGGDLRVHGAKAAVLSGHVRVVGREGPEQRPLREGRERVRKHERLVFVVEAPAARVVEQRRAERVPQVVEVPQGLAA